MLYNIKYYLVKIFGTAAILFAIFMMESYCFSRTPPLYFEVEEDIAHYKRICDEIYPLLSLEIEPKTNIMILTWSDGTVTRRK